MVDAVFGELVTVVVLAARELDRFEKLRHRVVEFCIDQLKQYVKPLKKTVTGLIDSEMCYINTIHPDFSTNQPIKQISATRKESSEITHMRNKLRGYNDIVRKTIANIVPKTIVKFLVMRSVEEIPAQVAHELQENDLENLLTEQKDVVVARRNANSTLKIMKKALKVLTDIRDS